MEFQASTEDDVNAKQPSSFLPALLALLPFIFPERATASATSSDGPFSKKNPIADYVYDTVGNDSRVMAIINNNQAATQAQLSRFDYTYRSDGTIQTWKQDQASIAGGAREWAFGYDGVDQLTSAVRRNPVSGAITASQGYRYDRSGKGGQCA